MKTTIISSVNTKLMAFVLGLFFVFSAQAQNLPRVKILATGGTIAGAGAAADQAGYKAGALPIDQLLSAVPQIHKYATVTGEQISSIGSQDMSIEIWMKLNKRINEIFSKNEADAVVITHGTDTQEETSFFLNLTLRSDKPVVFTGSMRAATAISADGPKNLFDAVVVAASPKSKGRGPIVVFSESIFDGRDIVKTSSTHMEAYTAPNAGPIGQVYDAKPVYYQESARKSDKNTPFDISGVTKMPRVEIVYMYADANPSLINALVNEKVDGIVIAGVGNGNFNKAYYDAIDAAVKKGVVVCRATRCVSGRVVLKDEVDDDKLGTIVSDDLNPQKARILLMIGLTKTKDKKQLQQYFFEY
ncbi:type II asparaginase [Flavobacterium limnosediminis]|nr:type II asparaginase [Flavobacterium limnosediminis]